MRQHLVLVALAAAVLTGCAKAPMPMSAIAGPTSLAAQAASTDKVSVGQISGLPMRCPCFQLEGTIGGKKFVIGFEEQGKTTHLEKVDIAGKAPTDSQTAALAKGIYAEAQEAFTQESTMSATRARQLFQLAAAMGVKGGTDEPAADAGFDIAKVTADGMNGFTLEAKMGSKSVEIAYRVINGFAGPVYEIRGVEVSGKRPTADDLKAIVAGLNAEADAAMRQEMTNSIAKSKLYRALAKALAR